MEFAINSNLPHFSFKRKFIGKVPTKDVPVVLECFFLSISSVLKFVIVPVFVFYVTHLTTSKTL